ncbi:hypothetical protein BH20ACI4_BH20ACI4_13620 [soil metagenome]
MLNKKTDFFCALFLTVIIIGCHSICMAQDEEKSIQSEELVKKRPLARTSGQYDKTPVNKITKQKKRYYRKVKSSKKSSVKPLKAAPKQLEDALLGFTVWKIRPATTADAAKELIEEERDGKIHNSEYTLERLLTESPLTAGERIRLSIESLSHSGYLYVVERELYSDGSFSDPKLIYPTLRSRYKNNPVSAGTLVFVPEGTRHFRVTSTQTEKRQVAEVLTIVVSPKPLIEPSSLQMKAIDVPIETMSEWLDQWEVDTTLLEQIDGEGQTITLVEQSAGLDAAKGLNEESSVLTQDDAVPQSIFRSKIKIGNPVLVNVYLNFKSN